MCRNPDYTVDNNMNTWPYTSFSFLCAGSCILTRSTLVRRLWWRLCTRLRSTRSPLWRVTVWSSSPSTSEPTMRSCSSLRLLSHLLYSWHLTLKLSGINFWFSTLNLIYPNYKIHIYLVSTRDINYYTDTFRYFYGFHVLRFCVISLWDSWI